jgi:hypothetical protein
MKGEQRKNLLALAAGLFLPRRFFDPPEGVAEHIITHLIA